MEAARDRRRAGRGWVPVREVHACVARSSRALASIAACASYLERRAHLVPRRAPLALAVPSVDPNTAKRDKLLPDGVMKDRVVQPLSAPKVCFGVLCAPKKKSGGASRPSPPPLALPRPRELADEGGAQACSESATQSRSSKRIRSLRAGRMCAMRTVRAEPVLLEGGSFFRAAATPSLSLSLTPSVLQQEREEKAHRARCIALLRRRLSCSEAALGPPPPQARASLEAAPTLRRPRARLVRTYASHPSPMREASMIRKDRCGPRSRRPAQLYPLGHPPP